VAAHSLAPAYAYQGESLKCNVAIRLEETSEIESQLKKLESMKAQQKAESRKANQRKAG